MDADALLPQEPGEPEWGASRQRLEKASLENIPTMLGMSISHCVQSAFMGGVPEMRMNAC
jgi:hypothetical protein